VCSDVRGCSFQPFPTLETQAQETWRTCVTSTVEKNNRLGQPPLRPITPQMLFPLTPFYDPLAHEAQQQAAYSRSRTNPALQLLQESQIASTAVLPKIPHSNSSKSVPNRPLRGRRGRFGTLLQQLECVIFERTAVRPRRGRFGALPQHCHLECGFFARTAVQFRFSSAPCSRQWETAARMIADTRHGRGGNYSRSLKILTLQVLRKCSKSASAGSYSRSPKTPTLQLLQKSSKSASTTPQRPIWNTFGTVAGRDFWESGCRRRLGTVLQ